MGDFHVDMELELFGELALLGAAEEERAEALDSVREEAHAPSATAVVLMMRLMASEARFQLERSASSWRCPAAVSS